MTSHTALPHLTPRPSPRSWDVVCGAKPAVLVVPRGVLMGIVHGCGGALHVTSTPGLGTRFRIHLPAASPPAAA